MPTEEKPPNILLILADDLGYGDPRCYNPASKILTPHIDRLAAAGVRYTDAHTTSSVCTPTRYGILTGQYAWRGVLKKGVTWSYYSLIIDRETSTLAHLLGEHGYQTACVGKWHLGLNWQRTNDSIRFDLPLKRSPLDLGFDHFYGITASLDIPPYVYLRGDSLVRQPTGFSRGTARGYYDDFWRNGPISPDFDHYESLTHLTDEAERYLRTASQKKAPFFLYFPLTAPHLPWIPKPAFRGTSGAGNYGDLTAEVDATVGRITDLLRELQLEENTLVVFTSDNGSQFLTEEMARYQHRANGKWRGRKGDIYEGGNRVPFIVRWPGQLPAGEVSDRLVATTDLYATFADLLGQPLPEREVKDSQSFLQGTPRSSMVYQAALGLKAYREADWVYVPSRGSGGFLEVPDTSGVEEAEQLYHLGRDGAQSVNLVRQERQRAAEMRAELTRLESL